MNFTPFGSPFATSIPNLHQFAAKFSQENVAVVENSSRYTANGIPSFTHHHHASTSQNIQPGTTTTSNSKYNSYLNAQSLYGSTNSLDKLVLSTAVDKLTGLSTNSLGTTNNSSSFSTNKNCFGSSTGSTNPTSSLNRNHFGTATNSSASFVLSKNKQNFVEQHHTELTQELCNALLQTQQDKSGVKLLEDVRLNSSLFNNQNQSHSSHSNSPWHSIASSSSTVADYLSQLPASSLPLSLHHFLKYSAENLSKKEIQNGNEISSTLNSGLLINSNNISNIFNPSNNNSNQNLSQNSQNSLTTINTSQLGQAHIEERNGIRKKRKKKIEKEKKPKLKPGEIRLTTALDGSTLYCCPECHMAYPEKELLEQHLLGHTMERKFVCDICGAGLKRKDHLTRHKQSHNPERPYICSVCLKAFKRKEQLTLHFVIHSGEKRHVCQECGKGFYRKDHLRKHTRSHIARRVKAELTQQGTTLPSLSTVSASNLMT